jgi:DNA-binding Lrp family transcriptional regulator
MKLKSTEQNSRGISMPGHVDHLDHLDVRILEGLAEHGPRNMMKLARELNTPRGTVITRINRMSSSFYLTLLTTVYHTNLGLKKAVVFAKAVAGREDLLFQCLKVNKFYIYLSRCFGLFEGCVGVYVIPVDHTAEFEGFLSEMEKLGITQNIKLFWSTCFHTVNRTRKWFDDDKETWVFPWEEWLGEVSSSGSELPYTLRDPESFPLRADETDLFMIGELEKDATVTLASIARKLGTTLQNIRYHYETHVVRRRLIETYQIAITFNSATSEMLFFVFKFSGSEKMGKFARSLLDKPFVTILGKILNENALISQVYLPRNEFRNFVDALSKLVRMNLLENYEYVQQDLRPGKWSRETIPYQLFKNGSWTYNHSQHLRALRGQVSHIQQNTVSLESTDEPVFST